MWVVLPFVSLVALVLMLPMTPRCDAWQLLVQGSSNSASLKTDIHKRYSSKLSNSLKTGESCCSSRRQAIGYVLASGGGMLITCPQSASAHGSSSNMRPYAPMEALIPATQKRLLLKHCLNLSKDLVEKQRDGSDSEAVQSQLKQVLPPPSDPVFQKPVLSMSLRYKMDPQVLKSLGGNDLSGVSMRAAMNLYTANLKFGESYVLTASDEDKKKYIRKYNQLPGVNQVIASDLDLRDLYRNQLQTKIEDAQAELYSDESDAVELYILLGEADEACRQWFALISDRDIEAAEKAALEPPALDLSNQGFSTLNFY